ncbi:competence/damage-inducible protein A [Clostridium sardiniense]|uniref:Putative competence-damage inducible protein n=1 Tax=Clostridium sardiniense TaxID=29369 RepID=A0ABS7L354_CLOSR|nr:competence/damage-inducible protein A [Clostridium sardiniense]MBY0757308.1 competence/damage-inducible protein A [Clostridium sardiniense]MDQ0461720.1 nicotinamide-nucleotide amidase [Clostridium sardiniense]
MKCEIIAVGTEVILGDILNSNAQYLAKELANLGVDVYYHEAVGDNRERILDCFKRSLDRSDIIITTGGLGPTKDDMTKELAAEFFGMDMCLHEESLQKIKDYFKKMGREFVKSNEKQAYFPKEAIILDNENGTAPGAIFEKDDKAIIVLPGPPKEMEPMFKNHVRKYLEKRTGDTIVSEVLRVFGIGESSAEKKLQDLIDNGKNPTIAPYAKEGEVIFRITAKAKSEEEAKKLINPLKDEVYSRLGDAVYNTGDTTLQDTVAKMLVNKDMTIGVSESCTGGLLSSKLIEYPGISKVFLEGAVTYSNEAKMRTLNVKKETLEKFGAVSHETAKEMAEGIAKRAGARIGVSTTGIAGPTGGTEEKPVGLVYFGIYVDGEVKSYKHIFTGDRNSVRNRASMTALDIIRRSLL